MPRKWQLFHTYATRRLPSHGFYSNLFPKFLKPLRKLLVGGSRSHTLNSTTCNMVQRASSPHIWIIIFVFSFGFRWNVCCMCVCVCSVLCVRVNFQVSVANWQVAKFSIGKFNSNHGGVDTDVATAERTTYIQQRNERKEKQKWGNFNCYPYIGNFVRALVFDSNFTHWIL